MIERRTNRNNVTGLLTLIFICLFAGEHLYAQNVTEQFRRIVDTTFAAHPAATGIMVSAVTGTGKTWSYAVGISDKSLKNKLSADQSVLIASNTKTYISAAILKLNEQKKLHITDAISRHLSEHTLKALVSDGYDIQGITIAHLLSHTSGIDDYVNDEYFDFVNSHRQYKWTRDEQISRAMETGKPLAAPGDTFKYADVNYLLLTEIIEQATHKPFFIAVRQLLNYKGLKLNATWFVNLEQRPVHTAALAHQYWNKYPWDSYELDPSWDLFGGGGIAATPADLALFFKYLFEGKVIKDANVLSKMYADLPFKSKTNYLLGIRKLSIEGMTGYYHGGFWGTDAIYFPQIKTAICIVVLEKSERDLSADICKAMAELLKKQASYKE